MPVAVEFQLRRGGFEGESSQLISRGTLAFEVGDGSVNLAVDELVRTLRPGELRRATVPASANLDRSGDRASPTYLVLGLVKSAKACSETPTAGEKVLCAKDRVGVPYSR